MVSPPDTPSPEEFPARMGSAICGTSERCRVLVRLRPLPTKEKSSPYQLLQNPERIVVDYVASNRTPIKKSKQGTDEDPNTFIFDKIFPQESTQQEVFDTVLSDSVDSVLAERWDLFLCNKRKKSEGFNATVLAYGQTGAGKTYNMFGGDTEEKRGMVPRALDALFNQVDTDDTGSTYIIKLSMLEIYLEELRDLLRPTAFSRLKLRESCLDGVWVENLHHICVPSSSVALELVMKGMENRTTGATNMNDASSRSHCIVSLRVEKTMPDGVVQTGVLHFADLAGMERVERTGAQGQTLEEAKRINLSLSALGNCIAALSDPNRTHIPFRDAKLTFLLKNSLGGNAKTTLLIAVSPRFRDVDETLGAFRFGQRATKVKNLVSVNRKLSAQELQRLLDKLQQEHTTLQDYCISLEERIEELSGVKKTCVDVSTGVGETNMSLYNSSTVMRSTALSPIESSPKWGGDSPIDPPFVGKIRASFPLPLSPAMKSSVPTRSSLNINMPWGGMSPSSPVHDMNPLVLLHKISVLEAEKRDMTLEIKALSVKAQEICPDTVAGTSLYRSRATSLEVSESDLQTESTLEVCRNEDATAVCRQDILSNQNQTNSFDQSDQTLETCEADVGHEGLQDARNSTKRRPETQDPLSTRTFSQEHDMSTQMDSSGDAQGKHVLRGILKKRGRSLFGLHRKVFCEITTSSLFYETALVGVRKELQLERVRSVSALNRSRFSIVTGNFHQERGCMRTFVFQAESDKQRDVWLRAINQRVGPKIGQSESKG